MPKYSKRASLRNHPDLFDWHRERELRYTNRAARRIAERYGLTFPHAATIAALGGIGPEVTRPANPSVIVRDSDGIAAHDHRKKRASGLR